MPKYKLSKEERAKKEERGEILMKLLKLSDKPLKTGYEITEYLSSLFKETLENAIKAEAEEYIGYDRNSHQQRQLINSDNYRNGYANKNIKSSSVDFTIKIPRDSEAKFNSQIIPKGVNDISDMEHRILALYSHGNTVEQVSALISEFMHLDVSPTTISKITEKLLPVIRQWQSRPLDDTYAAVFCDGKVVKVRENGAIVKKTIYTVLAYNMSGYKKILGFYVNDVESSKYWLEIFNDLKNRGVKRILIFCTDNLNGFSNAIATAFPKADIQKCIIHQIRNATKYVSYKDLKEFCADMKKIYQASNEEIGWEFLQEFKKKWSSKYGYAVKSWETNWPELSTFFKFSPPLRKMLYTTNVIENFNRKLSQLAKKRIIYNGVDSVKKDVYLCIQLLGKRWKNRHRDWGQIYSELTIIYEEYLKS